MNWISQNWWPLFSVLFVLFLLTSLWMAKLAKHFTLPSTDMHFSIFDLELPASEKSFIQLLKLLDDKTKHYLRQHLFIDMLFMPAAYLGIAMLCFRTAMKMVGFGKWLFLFLAAVQLIAWLLDIIENNFLLKKINNPPKELPLTNTQKTKSYQRFQLMVKIKFVIAFIGTACSVFGLLYYWIIGSYEKASLPWLGGLVVIALLPLLIKVLVKKDKKPKLPPPASAYN